jgi:hypothetical protein
MHQIRFPTADILARAMAIVYDQARDTLLVDYFAGQRSSSVLPISPHVILRIDPNSFEIVGYVATSYLQALVGRSPLLARALRYASFRSITDEELGDVAIVRSGLTVFSDNEAAAVAKEFVRMITPVSKQRDSA